MSIFNHISRSLGTGPRIESGENLAVKRVVAEVNELVAASTMARAISMLPIPVAPLLGFFWKHLGSLENKTGSPQSRPVTAKEQTDTNLLIQELSMHHPMLEVLNQDPRNNGKSYGVNDVDFKIGHDKDFFIEVYAKDSTRLLGRYVITPPSGEQPPSIKIGASEYKLQAWRYRSLCEAAQG